MTLEYSYRRMSRATDALIVAALLWSTLSLADEGDDACTRAYVSAQRLRKAGHLTEARAELLVCAKADCPPDFQKDFQPECVQWLGEVQRSLPSVVFGVRDSNKRDLTSVRVSIDGKLVADHLDGRSVDVDPGTHEVRLEPLGAAAHEVTIVAREGEHDRPILVDLPPPPTHRPVPASFWVLGATSLVSFGVFAAFGASGLSDLSGLAYCKGQCVQSDVDAVNAKYAAADVALGIGVVAAAVALVVLLTRPSVPVHAPVVGLRF